METLPASDAAAAHVAQANGSQKDTADNSRIVAPGTAPPHPPPEKVACPAAPFAHLRAAFTAVGCARSWPPGAAPGIAWPPAQPRPAQAISPSRPSHADTAKSGQIQEADPTAVPNHAPCAPTPTLARPATLSQSFRACPESVAQARRSLAEFMMDSSARPDTITCLSDQRHLPQPLRTTGRPLHLSSPPHPGRVARRSPRRRRPVEPRPRPRRHRPPGPAHRRRPRRTVGHRAQQPGRPRRPRRLVRDHRPARSRSVTTTTVLPAEPEGTAVPVLDPQPPRRSPPSKSSMTPSPTEPPGSPGPAMPPHSPCSPPSATPPQTASSSPDSAAAPPSSNPAPAGTFLRHPLPLPSLCHPVGAVGPAAGYVAGGPSARGQVTGRATDQ